MKLEESFLKPNSPERQVPDDLDEALSYLKKNGNFAKIRVFLNKNNKQESFSLNEHQRHRLNAGVRLALRGIQHYLKKDEELTGFNQLLMLKEAGVLTEDILKEEFGKFLTWKGESDRSFTDEQVEYLNERTKEILGWRL